MATRYSGNLRITCLYRDQGDYKCTVTPHGGRGVTIYVRPAPAGFGRGVAYDSPKAYDEIAHAAISFADDEERGLGEEAEMNESGWVIHRSPPSYSPHANKKGGGGANLVGNMGYFAARGMSDSARFARMVNGPGGGGGMARGKKRR